jgi:hypothetical protein
MSATYGVLRSDRRASQVTKCGTEYVAATAQTWETFATVTVRRDGRVNVEIRRADRTILDLDLSAEDAPSLELTVNRNDAYTLPAAALQSSTLGAGDLERSRERCAYCDEPMHVLVRGHHHTENRRDVMS